MGEIGIDLLQGIGFWDYGDWLGKSGIHRAGQQAEYSQVVAEAAVYR